MAGGTDLYMRIMVSATSGNTLSVIAGVARSLGSGGLLSALGNLKFGFANLGTSGTIGMDAIKQGAVGLGTALWKIALVAGVIGGIIAIAIGVLAVRAAANFQQGLNRLVTGAGDVTDNMKQMGQAILGVSVATGIMTGPLLSAMYQIISAGQRGAQAQNTLAVAAKGSVVEQANVVDVAKALTTAMTDYGTHTYNATQFMNGYTRATQLGKITLEELSQTMGPILPLAQNIGIKFADVAGAMSTMTNAGIPAARAATSLRFLFQSLENPTLKASTAMKHFGLDSIKLANELKVSLPGALQMVYDAAKKAGPAGSVPFNRAVSDMIGGQRSLQAYLALTGTHLATFKSNTAAITSAMDASKTSVLGWATAQSNANLQLSRVKAAGQALLITIGQGLLPVVTSLAAALVPIITGFTQWLVSSGALHTTITVLGTAFNVLGTVLGSIAKFFQQNELAMDLLKAVLIIVAGVIAGALVAALYAYIAAAWVAASATLAWAWPFLLIGAIIALVVAAVILVIMHWGAIMTWIGGIFSWLGSHVHAILSTMGAFIGGVFSAIGTKIHEILSGIGSFVGGFFSGLGTTIRSKLTEIKNTWDLMWRLIDQFFRGVLNGIATFIKGIFATIGGWFTWLYNHNIYIKMLCDAIVQFFHAAIQWIQDKWTAIVTWLVSKWNDLKAKVGEIFSAIGTKIHDVILTVATFISDKWTWIANQIGDKLTWIKNLVGGVFDWIGTKIHDAIMAAATFLYNKWDEVKTTVGSKLTDLKNTVGNAFSAMGTAMHDKIVAAWKTITDFVSGWPAQAMQWGINLIGGLISGIAQKIQDVKNIMGQVAGAIGNFLGFRVGSLIPPKEGPAKDADRWMPALMGGLTEGVLKGLPVYKAALNQTAPTGVTPGPSALPQRATGSAFASRGPVTIHAPITITVQQLDPREADRIAVLLGDKLRAQMGNI